MKGVTHAQRFDQCRVKVFAARGNRVDALVVVGVNGEHAGRGVVHRKAEGRRRHRFVLRDFVE